MEEYVFLLEYTNKRKLAGYHGRTQTVWANSQEEALKKLQSWKYFGYEPKFLHTMSEFKAKMAKEKELEQKLAEIKTKNKHVHVEVENV